MSDVLYVKESFVGPQLSNSALPFLEAGANGLLRSETRGFAIDATTLGGTVAVKDTTTPSNNRSNNLLNSSNLTQAGTSAKYCVARDGVSVSLFASGQIAQEFVPALSRFALLSECQRSNLALQSNDFTSASWTKVTLTTALNATGPDGVANSASTLTATGANSTALQAITSASQPRLTSMWVRRVTGSGAINITHDNGTTWTVVATTTSWTRVSNPVTTAANPTTGVRIVTSGDAIEVWCFQHETAIAGFETPSYPSSSIPTTTVAVTRAADDIQAAVTTFDFLSQPWTVYADIMWKSTDATDSGSAWSLFSDATNTVNARASGGGINLRIKTTNVNVVDIITGTIVINTRHQITFAAATNDADISFDGAAVVSDATNTYPVYSVFMVGRHPIDTTANFNGYIFRLVHVPVQVETRATPSITSWRFNFLS